MMPSYDKDDSRNPDSLEIQDSRLPKIDPNDIQQRPSHYALATDILPSRKRQPLSDLEEPLRKAAFLQGLGSLRSEEFQSALDDLKLWLPEWHQKFFWPVVLEVLNTPQARQTFSSNIKVQTSQEASFTEAFLTSLLSALDSSPSVGIRRSRCEGRILGIMVWWAPHTLTRYLTQAEPSSRMVRSFAVAAAFSGVPRISMERPSRELCRYLEDQISSAMADRTSRREVLLSGGAMQLASTYCTDLRAIHAVLSGLGQSKLFSETSALPSLTIFAEALERWAQAKDIDASDILSLTGRAAHTSLMIDHIVKRLSSDAYDAPDEKRDLLWVLLRISCNCWRNRSTSKSTSAANVRNPCSRSVGVRLLAMRGNTSRTTCTSAACFPACWAIAYRT